MEHELCFAVDPPSECLDEWGQLKDGALEIKLALMAAGGLIGTVKQGLSLFDKSQLEEMKVITACHFKAGVIIKLRQPIQPWQHPAFGCQIHQEHRS